MPGVRYGDWRYGRRPPVLLSRQVLGIGLDEQFCEHRVHDVSPGVGGCLAVLARTGAPEVNAIHSGGMKTPQHHVADGGEDDDDHEQQDRVEPARAGSRHDVVLGDYREPDRRDSMRKPAC
jgi:hypothetical protein